MVLRLLCNNGVLVFNSPFLKGVAFCLSLERQNDGVFIIKYKIIARFYGFIIAVPIFPLPHQTVAVPILLLRSFILQYLCFLSFIFFISPLYL